MWSYTADAIAQLDEYAGERLIVEDDPYVVIGMTERTAMFLKGWLAAKRAEDDLTVTRATVGQLMDVLEFAEAWRRPE